jgi:type IV secretion system protein VirD4
VPYAVIAWLGNRAAYAYRIAPGDVGENLSGYANYFFSAIINFIPSRHPIDFLFGVGAALIMLLWNYDRKLNQKKYRAGREYGSAVFGTPKDIEPFTDFENPDNNIILTQTEGLMMGDAEKFLNNRNKNVIVFGGAGAGKTFCFLEPNVMQMHSSYVITDTKGGVILHCGEMLEKSGYKIKIFNTLDFGESMCYNPFAYFRKEKLQEDIASFVKVLILNTGEKAPGGDDFWIKTEEILYKAYIAYIFIMYPPEDRHIKSVLDLVTMSSADDGKNAVDIMFDIMEMWLEGKPYLELKTAFPEYIDENDAGKLSSPPTAHQKKTGRYALDNYTRLKQSAKKTMQSILISCSARLSAFDVEGVVKITSRDEMELDKIGDRLTAMFIIIDDMKTTYNFLVAILYSQMFELLCEKAYKLPGKRLKHHVRCLLDEFGNIGQIHNFEKVISVIRSRGISACVIVQALSQIKAIYKDTGADTVISNCDSILFLGSSEMPTLEWMSKMLGKETIDMQSTSVSKGTTQGSYSRNQQKHGKELMSVDELRLLDGDKCVLLIRGVKPFLSMKFNTMKHKRYGLLSYSKERKDYDIRRAVKDAHNCRARFRKSETFSLFYYRGAD